LWKENGRKKHLAWGSNKRPNGWGIEMLTSSNCLLQEFVKAMPQPLSH
jgi:hypothetical protein